MPCGPIRRHWVGAGILALALAAPAAAAPPPGDTPTHLVIDVGLLARLRILAQGLHNEIVLCLTGAVEGPTAVATGFVMPDPVRSDADGALFGPCPTTALAVWHNHPLSAPPGPSAQAPSSYRRSLGDPGASARDLCALSESDIRTTAQAGYPFVVVAVGSDTWCWWTLAQVSGLARGSAIHGAPVPGQIESGARREGAGADPYREP